MKQGNRKIEVLRFFMENKARLFNLSYLDVAKATGNNIVHRYRRWLEDDGIEFKEAVIETKNKYGRPIKYKTFKLKSSISFCKKLIEKINK